MAFSAQFIRSSPKLETARFVTFLVDDKERRLGFRLTAAPEDNSLRLFPDGRKKNTKGRAAQTQALMNGYPWIRAVAELRDARLRQFKPEWDSIDRLWFVDLRPSFERAVTSVSDIPTSVTGIYRYLRGEDIVYIGRGQVRARGEEEDRRRWSFDRIEYSVVTAEEDQKRWEAYWLEEFRRQHGSLPEYNRIGGRKA